MPSDGSELVVVRNAGSRGTLSLCSGTITQSGRNERKVDRRADRDSLSVRVFRGVNEGGLSEAESARLGLEKLTRAHARSAQGRRERGGKHDARHVTSPSLNRRNPDANLDSAPKQGI